MIKWRNVTATEDEIKFAELVASGQPATEAMRQILPAERLERITYQTLRNLASHWLAKASVNNAIVAIRGEMMQRAMESGTSAIAMIQEGFAEAKLSRDAMAMIAAGRTLADITGETHANRRHIDLQYQRALAEINPPQPGQPAPERIDLNDAAVDPLKTDQ
jgi:hypothetical protein